MRTSIMLLICCGMFSCGLFKNTKTKKELDRIDTKEQMNFQHAAEENSSLMQSLDFKTRDSSETFSMLEFIPNGPISFDESTGLKFQASWARLYTMRKADQTVVGNVRADGKTKQVSETSLAKVTTNNTTAVSKEQTSTPSTKVNLFIVMAVLIVIAVMVRLPIKS